MPSRDHARQTGHCLRREASPGAKWMPLHPMMACSPPLATRRELPHFRVFDCAVQKVAPTPPLDDAVPILEPPLRRYAWR